MARITLKITKPIDRSAPPKAPSARAQRAMHGRKLLKAAPTPPAAPVAAPAAPPAPVPAAIERTSPTSAKPNERRRKSPKPADRRADAKATGSRRAAPTSPPRPSPPRPPAPSPSPRRIGPAPDPTRAPRHENPHDPRLSKRMSELGLCSRREADEWIENGWVKVDGTVVTTLGVRVSPRARIDIDPAAARLQSEQVTILLNKPMGYVSGQAEDGHEPAIVLIKPENRWADDPSPTRFKPSHLRGLAPAGRLDIDSTGLLVFTQDGRVAKHLIGRDSAVEKEYLVRVEGTLSDAGMKLLQHGLELDGVRLKPARVSWQNEHQLRVVLREGRKRQIRRMCELVGLVVTGLKRVRSGSVPLGALPVGQWRYLRRDEKF
jgi:23S rRNA pseudouridine2604 synthase